MTDTSIPSMTAETIGPAVVVNISTECEVNSRGTNCTAKTHVRGGFDVINDEAVAVLTHAKIVADAIAVASVESLRSSMNSIASGGVSQASLDFSLAVNKIGGDLIANFLQFMHESKGTRD